MPAHAISTRAQYHATRFAPPLGAPREQCRVVPGELRAARVRRVPAVAELRTLSIAVWPGEVVLVAGAVGEGLSAIVRALYAVAGGRVRAAMVVPRGEPDAIAHALVAPLSATTAVVAAVPIGPDALGGHAVEVLRRAVACVAPCRCVWMVRGRVHPRREPARLLPASAPL